MAFMDRWRRHREIAESDQPLEYGTGRERYHLTFKVSGGDMYHPKTYFLTTETNKKQLTQPEINEIAGHLLRKKYGGALFDAHVVKRYDRSTGKKG